MSKCTCRQADGVSARTVAGEAVILSPGGDTVAVCNATGAAVWNSLGEPRSPGDLAEALARATGCDADAARRDVNAFLADLAEAGMVSWSDADAVAPPEDALSVPAGDYDAPALSETAAVEALAGGCDSATLPWGSCKLTLATCGNIFE